MKKTRTQQQALKAVKAKASAVARFMNSPGGRQVIRMLELEFPGGKGKNPYETYYNLGSREPLEYLKQLQRIDEIEDLTDETL